VTVAGQQRPERCKPTHATRLAFEFKFRVLTLNLMAPPVKRLSFIDPPKIRTAEEILFHKTERLTWVSRDNSWASQSERGANWR
jgi:hypothetical protein